VKDAAARSSCELCGSSPTLARRKAADAMSDSKMGAEA
jgi:hypothetical protein